MFLAYESQYPATVTGQFNVTYTTPAYVPIL